MCATQLAFGFSPGVILGSTPVVVLNLILAFCLNVPAIGVPTILAHFEELSQQEIAIVEFLAYVVLT